MARRCTPHPTGCSGPLFWKEVLKTRVVRLVNAGCPYPYLFHRASGELRELRVTAYPLGVRPETVYPVIEVGLGPGDRLVFCSDGIMEAVNEAGGLFGFGRTAAALQAGCRQGLSAAALLAHLLEEVRGFTQGAPSRDDQTVVVLHVEERGSA